MKIIGLLLHLFFIHQAWATYPEEWWRPFPRQQAKSWEILPQDAKEGEVILSKRTVLGVFSNLSEAHFEYDGQAFASVEGLWQMMKYPDPSDSKDPRNSFSGYPYQRKDIPLMHGWESKKAGDAANDINKSHGIKWVSYKHQKFEYKDFGSGSAYHYQLIRGAIRAKVLQNMSIKKLLLKTKGLNLKPDHQMQQPSPPSYQYHKILMELREELLNR